MDEFLLFVLAVIAVVVSTGNGNPPSSQVKSQQTVIHHSTNICSGNKITVTAPGAVAICGKRRFSKD